MRNDDYEPLSRICDRSGIHLMKAGLNLNCDSAVQRYTVKGP